MFTFDEEKETPKPEYNGVTEMENEIIETYEALTNSESINRSCTLDGKVRGLLRAISLIKTQETIELNSRPWGPF